MNIKIVGKIIGLAVAGTIGIAMFARQGVLNLRKIEDKKREVNKEEIEEEKNETKEEVKEEDNLNIDDTDVNV